MATMIAAIGTSADALHAELRTLIANTRQRLAGAVNAELTRLYWNVGQRLRTEVLGEGRASYGAQLLDQLGHQLSQEFGRGFESRNLRRMVKFAEAFPDAAIVSTLSTQLSWSHMVTIVALKTPQARQFYASQAAKDSWSVRELAHQIDRKAFERTEIANAQASVLQTADAEPAVVFKDPYFLDFLGLRQGHDEGDLEAGITEAEYWTELLPKAKLGQKLHGALVEARERLARGGVVLGDLGDNRSGSTSQEFPVTVPA